MTERIFNNEEMDKMKSKHTLEEETLKQRIRLCTGIVSVSVYKIHNTEFISKLRVLKEGQVFKGC